VGPGFTTPVEILVASTVRIVGLGDGGKFLKKSLLFEDVSAAAEGPRIG
jgi:hypothetical protein